MEYIVLLFITFWFLLYILLHKTKYTVKSIIKNFWNLSLSEMVILAGIFIVDLLLMIAGNGIPFEVINVIIILVLNLFATMYFLLLAFVIITLLDDFIFRTSKISPKEILVLALLSNGLTLLYKLSM